MRIIGNLAIPVLCWLNSFSAQANTSGTIPLTIDSLRKAEILLKSYSDSMVKGSTDQIRQAASALFNPLMLDVLKQPVSFAYPFDSLSKTVSMQRSEDGRIKIYTWFLQSRNEGTYQYFGVIQRKGSGASGFQCIGLIDKRPLNEEAEKQILMPEEWYGAVYFDLVQKKIGKTTYYFLLGWQGNDRLTTRKVIEVLYFDNWNMAHFGSAMFFGQQGSQVKHRVIFEYNAQAVMLLRYLKNKDMFIFDHLSASGSGMKGQFQFYGPDFTYDGYRFKKGKWLYKSNLDLKN